MTEEETTIVESGTDQEQWPIEIASDLLDRLQTTKIIAQEEGLITEDDTATARLHVSICDQYMSGLIYARYMIALKFLVKELQNQDLNFTTSKLLLVTPFSTAGSNWQIIAHELDKAGMQVDEEVIQQICEGDQANIDRLFLRIERLMKVLCGPDFLNFQNIPEEKFQSMTDLFNQKGESSAVLEEDSRPANQKNLSMFLAKEADNFGLANHSIDNSQETINVNAPSNLIETRLVNESQKRPFKVVKEGVDIVTVQIDRPLQDTENSLEFLLVTLSRAFQLSPRQSASLLTNNNQYLISACIKGIKGGSFEPLFNWYKELTANIQVLVDLLRSEMNQFSDSHSNVTKVLLSISSGLYSQNEDIVKKTFALLIECFYFFAEDESLNGAALHWFLSTEDGGLKRSVYALRVHSDIGSHFVALCNGMCGVDQQVLILYKEEILNHCKTTFDYVKVVNEILEPLYNTKELEVVNCGLVQFWIELCVRESENDGKHSTEERIAALSLLTNIWLNFQNFVSQTEERANSILYMLKRACRESNRCVKITTTAFLFKLLDDLSAERQPSAPIIYKTLVFNLVENPSDLTVREMYLKNFQDLFQSQPSIPIALLMEPLLKQIQSQIGITYHLKTFDFEFFAFIADHKKLSVGLACQLFDFFSKLYLSEVTTFSAITIPLIRIVKRFCEESQYPDVERQVQQFIELALQQLFQIEEQLTAHGTYQSSKKSSAGQHQRPLRPLRASSNKAPSALSSLASPKDQPLLQFRRQIIVTMLQRLQHIHNDTISQTLAEQLRQLQTKVIQQFENIAERHNNVVDGLLEFYGTSTLLVPKPSISEHMSRKVSGSRGSNSGLQKQIRKVSSDKKTQQAQIVAEKMDGIVVPYKGINRNQVGRLKAIQELEQVRILKAEKEEQKRQEEENMRQLAEKKKVNLRRLIQKRRDEIGFVRESNNAQPLAIVQRGYHETTDELHRIPPPIFQGVQWFEIDLDEEDCDRDAFNLLIRKYSKLWRLMFGKFANTGFKVNTLQERSSFEGLKQQQEVLSLAEVTKMLKEFNMYPMMIGKDDLLSLVRLVNMKMGCATVLTFDYARFLVFITQVSLNIYSKVRSTMYQAPQLKLQRFIQQIESSAREKQQSVAIFEEIQGGKDQDKIAVLNHRLSQDPNYPLPEGFIKYKELGSVHIYEVVSVEKSAFIGESTLLAYSIVDDLMDKLFGFHVVEPKTVLKEQHKAKSLLQKNFKTALRYESQDRASVVNDRYSGMRKSNQLEPLVPKMSDKLMAMAQESKQPELIFEIASILEGILQQVERGGIPPKQKLFKDEPQNSQNKAVQSQKEKEEQWKARELSREKKRKERDARIKQDLEKLKPQKAEKEAELELQKKEQSKLERQADKKKQEAIRRSIQKIADDAYAAKEKKAETEEKRSIPSQNSRGRSKPPNKEQLVRISENNDQIIKKLAEQKVTLQQKEEEVRLRDILLREAIKRKTEQALALNKDQRQKDVQFQQHLQEFLQSESVVEVNQKYGLYLEHMFKFYCSQGKVDLGVDLKFKQKHMDQKEFVKFGYQSKVVPVLINSDELIQIFKVLCKMHYEASHVEQQSTNLKSLLGHTIDFSTFKEALARICVYANMKLGGQTEDQITYTQEVEGQRRQNEIKLKEIVRKKENDRKNISDAILSEMKAEFNDKIRKAKEVKEMSGRSPSQNKGLSQSRSEVSLSNLRTVGEDDKMDDQKFQKWLKQQDNIGNGLLKRVHQRLANPIEIQRSQNSSQVLLKQRPTLHEKQIQKLESEALVKERLGREDIRDNRQVKREMDIKVISAGTLQALFTFIGAIEGEVTVAEMEAKLNSQRIEIQGQKPQKKIKNLLLPQLGGMTEPEKRPDSNLTNKISARISPKPLKRKIQDQVIQEEADQQASNRKFENKTQIKGQIDELTAIKDPKSQQNLEILNQAQPSRETKTVDPIPQKIQIKEEPNQPKNSSVEALLVSPTVKREQAKPKVDKSRSVSKNKQEKVTEEIKQIDSQPMAYESPQTSNPTVDNQEQKEERVTALAQVAQAHNSEPQPIDNDNGEDEASKKEKESVEVRD